MLVRSSLRGCSCQYYVYYYDLLVLFSLALFFFCFSGCPFLPLLAANVLALPEEAPALLSYEVRWSRPAPLAVCSGWKELHPGVLAQDRETPRSSRNGIPSPTVRDGLRLVEMVT